MGFVLHGRVQWQAIAGRVTDCCLARIMYSTWNVPESIYDHGHRIPSGFWISAHDDWRGCVNLYRSPDSRLLYVYEHDVCFFSKGWISRSLPVTRDVKEKTDCMAELEKIK